MRKFSWIPVVGGLCGAVATARAAPPTFSSHEIGRAGGCCVGSTDLVDIDNDGDLDWVSGHRAGAMWWFEYTGQPNGWKQHIVGNGHQNDVGGDACDLDGDGKIDIAAGATWYHNQGGGKFAKRTIGGIRDAHDTVCADMDSDGDLDVVNVSSRSDEMRWYENDGTGSGWQAHRIHGSEHGSIAPFGIGDIDGDGDMDAVRVRGWLENSGSGATFTYHQSLYQNFQGGKYGDQVRSAVVDVDLDGDNDIVTVAGDVPAGRGRGDWWENLDGKGGSFAQHTFASGIGDLHSLAVADFDNDGDWDIFSCEGPLSGSGRAFIWENIDGKGATLDRHQIHAGDQCHEAVAGDVDQDGDVDLAFKPWNGNKHVYLQNTSNTGGGLGVIVVGQAPGLPAHPSANDASPREADAGLAEPHDGGPSPSPDHRADTDAGVGPPRDSASPARAIRADDEPSGACTLAASQPCAGALPLGLALLLVLVQRRFRGGRHRTCSAWRWGHGRQASSRGKPWSLPVRDSAPSPPR